MKYILKLLSVLVLFIIAGCGIENIDKPPLGNVYGWEKPGADFTEVGKALLECGMPSPEYLDRENRRLSYNDSATIYACMIQAGFHDKLEREIGTWCENFKEENLPICQPGAVIPKRSVEKRLNSPFCKRSPEQPECKP
ncbi:phage protein [Bartonella kosoyi]|uniref:Phage protein n=1 Tax=Bartonella kosoyi TaxID=2133959 RepID=A0A5B9CX31_9HYPH|nr:hypothetical protein [Bartonella kosoyi]QEE08875.1 phage protein [Bartonella kosoyi]